MENFNANNPNAGRPGPPADNDKPIPFDDQPIPFDDQASAKPQISREPLHLKPANPQPPAGQMPPAGTQKQPAAPQRPPAAPQKPVPPAPAQAQPQPQAPRPAAPKPPAKVPFASAEKITRVRTFYTKLHEGAITFLDDQINTWLKENPGIVIKQTNTTVGEIAGKRTEPSLVITIWY